MNGLKRYPKFLLFPLLLSLAVAHVHAGPWSQLQAADRNSSLQTGQPQGRREEVPFSLISEGFKTFPVTEFGNVFLGGKNSIVKLAPELQGLTGIKVPASVTTGSVPLKINLKQPAKLLLGVCRDSADDHSGANILALNFHGGRISEQPLLKNAVTIAGIPAVDVYTVSFSKGIHTIDLPGTYNGQFVLLGTVAAHQAMEPRDAHLPDGRLWQPFIVEGFYEEPPLMEVTGGQDKPVVDEGMAGTEGIQGGFEGGACVKVGDTYHLFPTERAGEKGVGAYYDRVKTRIGHWTSKDAIHWSRQATLFQSSGTYALTDDDNPLNDRRAAIWSYMPVFNAQKNRWYGYYLTYTVHKEIAPNHSFGRIWRTESKTPGINGINGPYNAGQLIMEPGLNSQLWEGRQGVASFFPFPVKDKWLAFYAGAFPYLKKEDYPRTTGQGWFIGLAQADSLEGPWKRLDTTVNPVTSIHPTFVENPIVYQMPNGWYLAIFDGGPEGWGYHFPNMMGYSTSKDGLHWSEAHYLPFQTKIQRWWDIMRTPLCLIPEGNDRYTIVFAAINNSKRFHPMGMVQVKINEKVLEEKMKE